jgi:hypothetical protein
MVLILRWFWLFLVAFGLLLGTASGGYVEATSLRAWTLIPGYGQGKAVVKEVVEQGVKQGMKLGSAILDATRALPAPSGGVITDASRMLPWNGGGASSFVRAGDEWLSPSFTNSTEWFHDGWRGGEAVRGGSNPVPDKLARVIPGTGPFPTLGAPGRTDVFVTAADDIAGLTPAQISQRLTIPASDTFTIICFPTPGTGIASPVFRPDPGFIGGGRTLGGAREFVLPNGPIPSGATTTILGP